VPIGFFWNNRMNSTLPAGAVHRVRSTAKATGVLESSAARTVSELIGSESVGLPAAGIDPRTMRVTLPGSADLAELLEKDTQILFPEAAKRKVEEDADEDDDEDEEEDEDVVDDEEEDEEDEEEDDLEEDEEEEEDDDEDEEEEEEDDEFDDPDDDDDDFDDDDDEDDFDDDE